MAKKSLGEDSLRSTLRYVFGLSGDTINSIIKTIHSQGEAGAMKIHLNNLGGVARTQLEHAISSATERARKMGKEEGGTEEESNKEEMKESFPPTFKNFLIEIGTVNQVANSNIDTMSREKMTKLARLDPDQRKAYIERERRKEKRQEKNPKIRALLKRKEQLEREIAAARAAGS